MGLVFRVNNFVVELWLRSRCDCKRVYITLAGTNLEGVVPKANGQEPKACSLLHLPYKVTKKPSHNQQVINLFSISPKILYRGYVISHLRNVALLQGGTFAVGILNYEL